MTSSPPSPDPQPPATSGVYGIDANDPDGRLVDRAGVDRAVLAEVGELMAALGALRDAEEQISEASMRYMRLGRTDMRALHFLIVTANQGGIATPGAIAAHLGITTPSTTKLLDRLERGGHITRSRHPHDRRAWAIEITPETREAATRTVGAMHARRFHSAARLSSEERAVVTGFLRGMAADLSLAGVDWAEDDPTGAPDA